MTVSIENKTGYAYHQSNMGPDLEGKPNSRPRHNLNVSFIMDVDVGPYNKPQHLMKRIASHPYIAEVTLLEDDGRPMVTDVFITKAIEEIDDHYDLREVLKAWTEGSWDEALSYLKEPNSIQGEI